MIFEPGAIKSAGYLTSLRTRRRRKTRINDPTGTVGILAAGLAVQEPGLSEVTQGESPWRRPPGAIRRGPLLIMHNFELRERMTPFISLRNLLDVEAKQPRYVRVAVTAADGIFVGLAVDAVLGRQRALINSRVADAHAKARSIVR